MPSVGKRRQRRGRTQPIYACERGVGKHAGHAVVVKATERRAGDREMNTAVCVRLSVSLSLRLSEAPHVWGCPFSELWFLLLFSPSIVFFASTDIPIPGNAGTSSESGECGVHVFLKRVVLSVCCGVVCCASTDACVCACCVVLE